jgi:rubrerythrin
MSSTLADRGIDRLAALQHSVGIGVAAAARDHGRHEMTVEFDFSMLDAQDVLDIATFVEDEAQQTYEQLVTWMKDQGNHEVAGFFQKMVGFEVLHKRQISEKRTALFGDAAARYNELVVSEVEAPDMEKIGPDCTLEQALELAKGAETKAHDYYARAKEYISEPEVLALLDELCEAELQHKRMLEAMERKLLT